MKPQDFKEMIDKAVAKYGPDFEIFIHGPAQEGAFLSGFGPECNFYMTQITQIDNNVIKALFVHGLPIEYPEKEGHQAFPVLTGQFPLRSKKIDMGDF